MVLHKETCETEEKLKLILTENGELIPDIYNKLPGKCYWVRFQKEDIENIIEKKASLSPAHSKSTMFQTLFLNLEKQFKKNIFLKLSLARKSGNLIFGFERVKMALKSGDSDILFHANNGSPKELKRIKPRSVKLILVSLFNSNELGKVFNRDNVAHSCVLKGGLAKSLILDVKKLEGIQN